MKRMIKAADSKLDPKLMAYIPKEFKPYVVDIYEGEKSWNTYTKRWNTELIVEWVNGKTTYFQNKQHGLYSLKELYSIEEVRD